MNEVNVKKKDEIPIFMVRTDKGEVVELIRLKDVEKFIEQSQSQNESKQVRVPSYTR